MLTSMVMSQKVYANENTWLQLPGHHNQSILLTDGKAEAEDVLNASNSARGIRLSNAMLSISNEQNGTLHISVDTTAHKNIDRIYQVVFLRQWDEVLKGIGIR